MALRAGSRTSDTGLVDASVGATPTLGARVLQGVGSTGDSQGGGPPPADRRNLGIGRPRPHRSSR